MKSVLQLDRKRFLAEYWQRKHLLIRDAISDFKLPLGADELAGLAMEDEVESRIVEQQGDNWQLFMGPFEEQDFQRKQPWTLLVQAVDHYVPDVAALRQLIDFIPQWRVDDVMVSYAEDGGSVGPHYDNYDVFLLQGEGQREWRIGAMSDAQSPLLANPDLKILADFKCEHSYILNPGDILYVPPGVAHWGIAQGECTTFSIGFRAPRINNLLSHWVDDALEGIDADLFYSDPDSRDAFRPGEIPAADIERARSLLLQRLSSSTSNRWFGEQLTEPRYEPLGDEQVHRETIQLLHDQPQRIELPAEAKLAWQQLDGKVQVFANGLSAEFDTATLPLIQSLCADWFVDGPQLKDYLSNNLCLSLLEYLIQCECLYVE
jgi:50S ribosomal protein L16 3-hydroxylase